jgi:protein-L-isoaspartate(D-aspartate) O-methyltransferase
MLPTLDFAAARDVMVDGQLRPTKITHAGVIAAMRTLPREKFVPAALAPLAYIDDDLKLTKNRFLARPLTTARLAQLADPAPGMNILVIGAATGYTAAVMAAGGAMVTALEEDDTLLAIARRNAALMPGVSIVQGPLTAGLETGLKFDAIVIEGAVPAIPAQFARMLTENGCVIAILSARPGQSVAVTATLSGDGFRVVPAFDVFAPALPAFCPAPAFAL